MLPMYSMLPAFFHWYLIFSFFWSPQSRETFTKNTVQSYTVWLVKDNGQRKPEKRIEINPHGDVSSAYRYSNNEVTLTDTFIYSYDSGQEISSIQHEDVLTKYIYTPEGKVARRDEYSSEGKIPERHTIYLYDKLGRLTESRSQHEDEATPYLVKKYDYPSDTTVKEVRYSEGKLFETTYYSFNRSGQLVRMESTVNGGAGTVSTTYQYDDKGLLASESTSAPGKQSETRNYEYTFYP